METAKAKRRKVRVIDHSNHDHHCKQHAEHERLSYKTNIYNIMKNPNQIPLNFVKITSKIQNSSKTI